MCWTTLDNILTQVRDALVVSLLAGYEIDFATLIRLKIHEHEFSETTSLPFPSLIQQLCDMNGGPDIPDIDINIKVMRMTNISLIKALENSILAQRAQPPPTMILVYFEGFSILIEAIDRTDISDDFDMDEQRAPLENNTEKEGSLTTATITSTFTSKLVGNLLLLPAPQLQVLLVYHMSYYSAEWCIRIRLPPV